MTYEWIVVLCPFMIWALIPYTMWRESKASKRMTDKRNVKICCDDMGNARMMGNVRDYKGREKDVIGSIVILNDKLYIAWADGDCMPLNYCPSCGKKVELVKE